MVFILEQRHFIIARISLFYKGKKTGEKQICFGKKTDFKL